MCTKDCDHCLNPDCIIDENQQSITQLRTRISSDPEFRKNDIENYERSDVDF